MVCQRKTSEVLSVAEGKLQSYLVREGEMGHLETMLFFVDQSRETKGVTANLGFPVTPNSALFGS